jgi:hypothetical protein
MTAEYVTTTAALPAVNTEVAFGGIVNQHNYIDAYVDFLANVGQRVQLRLYSTAGPLGVRSLVAQSPWLLAGSEPTRALQAIKYVSGNLYELFAIADGVCTNIKCSLVGYEAQENYIPEDESTGDVALVFGTNVTFATITNPHSYFDASVQFNTFLNKEVLWSLYATAGPGGVRARVAQSKSPRATINNQQLVVLENIGPIGASQMEFVGNCLEPFTGSGIVRGSLIGFDPIVDILNVVAPKTSAPASTGLKMSIRAQSAIGPNSVGGELFLASGDGTLIDSVGNPTGGAVTLQGHRHTFGPDASTITSGDNSFAWGLDSQATSMFAVSFGAHCRSLAAGAIALGESCVASYANAVAIGWNNIVGAYGAVASGMYLQIVAGAEGGFCCGVSAVCRLPGEFTHGSGIAAAKVGFTNIGHREIDVGCRANGAPANCKMRDTIAGPGVELTLQEFCLSSITVRVSGGTTNFGKVASEEATVLVKTTSSSVSTIVGTVDWRKIGQTFLSQGWSVTISVTGKTLRIACNPGADDVEFFARVDIMDQAL